MRDRYTLAQIAKNVVWQAAYRSSPPVEDLIPGYALLLPVPADIPVFLYIALQNAKHQDPAHRVETIVVPDMSSAEFTALFQAAKREFDIGPIRLVSIGKKGDLLRQISRSNPNKIHFLQIDAATNAAVTTHALLHDADLFINDPGFSARNYQRCAEKRLACVGVSECWDQWLRQHDFDHVVATWELMFDVRWFRNFAPWRHRSHHAWLDGEWHGFDTMLFTQAVTPAERLERQEVGDSFEHFNWVISTYRHFQRSGERPFRDERFVLLLIRLLTDALRPRVAGGRDPTTLPSIGQLAKGVTDPTQPVIYSHESADRRYHEFRDKLARVLESPVLEDASAEAIDRALRPFDAAFAYGGKAVGL